MYSSVDFRQAMSWENLFSPYANNKGADQPAHLRSGRGSAVTGLSIMTWYEPEHEKTYKIVYPHQDSDLPVQTCSLFNLRLVLYW